MVFVKKKKSWIAIACLDWKRNLGPVYALGTFLCTHLQGCINDKGWLEHTGYLFLCFEKTNIFITFKKPHNKYKYQKKNVKNKFENLFRSDKVSVAKEEVNHTLIA